MRSSVPSTFFRGLLWLALAAAAGPGREALAQTRNRYLQALERAFERMNPEETIAHLASLPSRVTGYPGCREAADYIEQRFREIGLEDVGTSKEGPFKTVVPVEKYARLIIGRGDKARRIELHCLWPNLVRTSKLPPDGISGRLIYARSGHLAAFRNLPVKGGVVLMDFDCSTRWLNAAMLGARAIVFIEPRSAFRSDAEEKFLLLPLNAPRFWLSRKGLVELGRALFPDLPASAAPEDVRARLAALDQAGPDALPRVKLEADMVWEECEARNVVGTIYGIDPELKKETVFIEAYYDTISVAPAVAPGAESTCGIAALLELAKALSQNLPRRTVVFLATAGHHQGLAGMRAYMKPVVSARRSRLASKQVGEEDVSHLYISLDLSSRQNQLGIFFKGHFYDQYGGGDIKLQREFRFIGNRIMDYADYVDQAIGDRTRTEVLSGVVPRQGKQWRSLLPAAIALDSEVVTLCGLPGVAFVTTNDARNIVDTPLDTFDPRDDEQVNMTNLRRQIQTLMGVFMGVSREAPGICNDPAMPMTAQLEDLWGDAFCKTQQDNLIAYLPATPMPDAVVAVQFNPRKSLMGVRGTVYVKSDSNALFELQGLSQPPGKPVGAAAFILNRDDGSVEYSPQMRKTVGVGGVQLRGRRVSRRSNWLERRTDARLSMFPCVSTTIYDLVDQLNYTSLSSINVMEAGRDSAPRNFAYFLGKSGGSYSEPCAVIYTEKGIPIKLTMSGGLIGRRLTLLNAIELYEAALKSGRVQIMSAETFESLSPAERSRILTRRPVLETTDLLEVRTDRGPELATRLMLESMQSKPRLYGHQRPDEFRPRRVNLMKDEIVEVSDGRGRWLMTADAFQNLPERVQRRFETVSVRGKDDPLGRGFDPSAGGTRKEFNIYHTSFKVAKDMWRLDDARIKQLASTGVTNHRVEELHRKARRLIEQADAALWRKEYDTFFKAARAAWALEAKAYPAVRATENDVVKGVIFYFAILLPFVIFAERLFLGLADIRKRLVAIGVIFAIVYFVLRWVHPAFKISPTPIIILIGFFMFSLGLIVIVLILNKFNAQMAALRQTEVIRGADVARASAAVAAFMLGISNMRKRKVRTTLTCVTLVLLTFSLLSLTSFESATRYNEVPMERRPPYQGILLRRENWSPLEEHAYYSVLNYFQEEGGLVAVRSWYSSNSGSEYLHLDVMNVRNPDKRYVARGLIGLDPQENRIWPIAELVQGDKKVWFHPGMPGYPYVCMLPQTMAEDLDARVGDTVRVLGSDLKVVGILDTEGHPVADTVEPLKPGEDVVIRLTRDVAQEGVIEGSWVRLVDGARWQTARVIKVNDPEAGPPPTITVEEIESRFPAGTRVKTGGLYSLQDLDEEPITPVDYIQMQQRREEDEANQVDLTKEGDAASLAEELKPDLYIHMPPDWCVVTPNDFALRVGASLRSVAIRMKGSEEQIKSILEKYVEHINLLIFAGVGDEVYLYSSRGALSVKGLGALLAPMAIAALIVFNTMLGSVYERLREIFIYASVGLAPGHIAALFFAESSVYAVMGAIIGYLLGQIVAKLVTLHGVLTGLNLNYSSTAAVWTTMIVVGIVLLSTIYPARKAAQLSVPDETRKMRLPKAVGDDWDFVFPFTVSSVEALAVNMFLTEYFEAHDEDSIGRFISDQVRLSGRETPEGWCYQLEALVWVAPLDAGISQSVRIETVPSPTDERLHMMRFHIHRESGEQDMWQRMNAGFLRAVRKQLLVWRLVPAERKKELEALGQQRIRQASAPASTSASVDQPRTT